MALPEYHRFSKGLFAWVGYETRFIPYTACERASGTTKWSFWKLVNYAIEGIIGFSTAPLRLATLCGSVTGIAAIVYLVCVILEKLTQKQTLECQIAVLSYLTKSGSCPDLSGVALGGSIEELWEQLSGQNRPEKKCVEILPEDSPVGV